MGLSPRAQEEFRRLQTDISYFYDKFLSTPEEPHLYDYQKEMGKDAVNAKYLEYAFLKGRQIGASWFMGVVACWYAMMNEGRTILIVSFNLDQAQHILNYTKNFIARLKKKGLYDFFVEGASMKNVRFNNGSKIVALGCILPETVILNKDKTKTRADEVKIGDNILDSAGNWQKVTRVFNRPYDGNLYKINAHHILPFEVTDEHPIKIGIRGNKRERLKTNYGRVWEIVDTDFREPAELKLGDYLIFPKFKPNICVKTFKFKTDWRSNISRELKLNADLSRLFGYYVSEGYTYKNGRNRIITFALSRYTDDPIIKDLENIIKSLGYSSWKRERNSAIELSFSSKYIGEILEKDFGRGAKNKRIPEYIMNSPDNVVINFLKAYHAGDGSIIKTNENRIWRVNFSTTSEKLALQLQFLITRFNIPISISKYIREPKEIEGRLVPEEIIYEGNSKHKKWEELFKLEPLERGHSKRQYIEDQDNFYFPITKITERHYKGSVCNFETKDHTYLVNNIIVHNCTVPDAHNVRGYTAHMLIVDEAAFIYDRMFPSITPTTANTGGKMFFLSTAGSIGSYFYRKWEEGNRAERWTKRIINGEDIGVKLEEIPKVKSYVIPSTEILPKQKLDREKASLGDSKYNREYLCTKPDAVILGTEISNPLIKNVERGFAFSSSGLTEITENIQKDYNGLMYSIESTHNLALELTPEHPVKIGIPEIYYSKRKKKTKIKEHVWKKPEKIYTGEYLICPKLKEPEQEIILNLSNYIERTQYTIPKKIVNGNLKLTIELSELLGYWVAEGSVGANNRQIRFHFGKHEQKLIDRTKYLIKRLFNYNAIEENTRTTTDVIWNCSAFARFLKEQFGHTAKEKHLPDFFYKIKKDHFISFARAFIAGDGIFIPFRKYKRKRYAEIRMNSISKHLLLQIQYIMTKFNLHIGIRKSFNEGEGTIEGRKVNINSGYELFTTDPKILNFLKYPHKRDKLPWKNYLEDDDFFYLRINKIKKEIYEGTVYNIETKNNTYLLSNVIVHNCMWAGTADQVFSKIPTFTERRMPTRTLKTCFSGIDVGKVNDPTVLAVIEAFFSSARVMDSNGLVTEIQIPYRVIYLKHWEREIARNIAADIYTNIQPRFPSKLYSIDATGGFGDELLTEMINRELPTRGTKVKTKIKNELMLGSPAMKGLGDAFQEELLWVNDDINDIESFELLFELNAYTGKLMSNGLYTFDSTVDRDHMVDSLAHAWSSVQAGTFEAYVSKRRR